MSRKKEVTAIHPRTVVNTLNEYLSDVNFMQSTMDNAHRFLTDETLNTDRARKVVAEHIKEAMDRMQKWRDAK